MPLSARQHNKKRFSALMFLLLTMPLVAHGGTAVSLQETLAANALILQARQREKHDLERDLVRLARESIPLQEQYQSWHRRMQSMLIGIQRLARTPPETILSHPETPEYVIRSSLLLRMVIADMHQQIQPLRDVLAEHQQLEQQISHRKAALTALEQTLADENLHLEKLLVMRQQQIQQQTDRNGQANEDGDIPPPDQVQIPTDIVATDDDARLPPPRWVAPLAGVPVSPPADSPANHQGLWIEGQASDVVLSPADGIVRYVGPFRGYGLIMIIQHGGGYHSLLAGIDSPMVWQGQQILGGEPVARLRSRALEGIRKAPGVAAMPPATTFHTGDSVKRHLLYFEVRYHGKSEMPDHLASMFKKKDFIQ